MILTYYWEIGSFILPCIILPAISRNKIEKHGGANFQSLIIITYLFLFFHPLPSTSPLSFLSLSSRISLAPLVPLTTLRRGGCARCFYRTNFSARATRRRRFWTGKMAFCSCAWATVAPPATPSSCSKMTETLKSL